jgi:hypothetical protein
MELLVCVLNEPNMLHDVISAFVEAGVGGGTVIESQGIGHILAQDIPIFAGFRHLLSGARPHNHTIFAVVEGPEMVREISELVRDVLATSEIEHPGIIFSVPVSHFEVLSEP